jgi:hypothetical protein
MKGDSRSQKPTTSRKDAGHKRVTRERIKRLQETVNNDLHGKPSGKEADNSTSQTAITLDNNKASFAFHEQYDTAYKPKFLDYKLVQNRIFVRVLESEFKGIQDIAASENIPHTTQRNN